MKIFHWEQVFSYTAQNSISS